jgi:hypothetical protein
MIGGFHQGVSRSLSLQYMTGAYAEVCKLFTILTSRVVCILSRMRRLILDQTTAEPKEFRYPCDCRFGV